jgi:hypothetical protein
MILGSIDQLSIPMDQPIRDGWVAGLSPRFRRAMGRPPTSRVSVVRVAALWGGVGYVPIYRRAGAGAVARASDLFVCVGLGAFRLLGSRLAREFSSGRTDRLFSPHSFIKNIYMHCLYLVGICGQAFGNSATPLKGGN